MKDLKRALASLLMLLTVVACNNAGKSRQQQDAMQQLDALVKPYFDEMRKIEETVYSDTVLSRDAEWDLAQRYKLLADKVRGIMREEAAKNIDSELGFLIVTQHLDPFSDAQLLDSLIALMSQDYRQREEMVALEEQLKAGKAVEVGQKIADFNMNTPDDESLSVMSLVQKNQLTILDFWASWCSPCRNEMPFMRQLYAKYQPKGLGIVGISLDKSAADWNRAIGELKMEWPQMSDLKGWECMAAKRFCVRAIPHIIILDHEGRILRKGLRGEELEQFIATQLE